MNVCTDPFVPLHDKHGLFYHYIDLYTKLLMCRYIHANY